MVAGTLEQRLSEKMTQNPQKNKNNLYNKQSAQVGVILINLSFKVKYKV